MSKKTNLAEAMKSVGEKPLAAARQAAPRTASRRGGKTVAGWFPIEVSNQLKIIGINNGNKTVQDLLAEALNDLFTKYGKSPIA